MTRYAAALLAAVLALAGCDDSKPPPKPAAAPEKPKAPVSTRPLTPSWPATASAKSDQASVSGDLLFARNYYVVLDASGSMTERGCSGDLPKIDAARNALAAFAESLPANANLGLQVFDARGVREQIPLATGEANRAKFKTVLSAVRAGGGTPLHTAITQAYARLEQQGSRQLGYGEYHLVVVTDGEASDGQDPTGAVRLILDRSPIVLHTIGFCIGPKHSLNQPGRIIYRAADNPQQLREHLSDVLAEAPAFSVTGFK
jgi:uncharacterized protein YegL